MPGTPALGSLFHIHTAILLFSKLVHFPEENKDKLISIVLLSNVWENKAWTRRKMQVPAAFRRGRMHFFKELWLIYMKKSALGLLGYRKTEALPPSSLKGTFGHLREGTLTSLEWNRLAGLLSWLLCFHSAEFQRHVKSLTHIRNSQSLSKQICHFRLRFSARLITILNLNIVRE